MAVNGRQGQRRMTVSPSDLRALAYYEHRRYEVVTSAFKIIFGSMTRFTDAQTCALVSEVLGRRLLASADLSLACGLAMALVWFVGQHPAISEQMCEAGLWAAVWALHGRVCPERLSAEWWVSTCGVVDVTSAQLSGVRWLLYGNSVPMATVSAASWWVPLRAEAVHTALLNKAAGLSGCDTMAFTCCSYAGYF